MAYIWDLGYILRFPRVVIMYQLWAKDKEQSLQFFILVNLIIVGKLFSQSLILIKAFLARDSFKSFKFLMSSWMAKFLNIVDNNW